MLRLPHSGSMRIMFPPTSSKCMGAPFCWFGGAAGADIVTDDPSPRVLLAILSM